MPEHVAGGGDRHRGSGHRGVGGVLRRAHAVEHQPHKIQEVAPLPRDDRRMPAYDLVAGGRIVPGLEDRPRNRVDVTRVAGHRRVTADLGDRGDGRHDGGRAVAHRLDGRIAEALVERRVDEHPGPLQQILELARRQFGHRREPFGMHEAAEAQLVERRDAHEHHPQVCQTKGITRAGKQPIEGGSHRGRILLRSPRVEHEREGTAVCAGAVAMVRGRLWPVFLGRGEHHEPLRRRGELCLEHFAAIP